MSGFAGDIQEMLDRPQLLAHQRQGIARRSAAVWCTRPPSAPAAPAPGGTDARTPSPAKTGPTTPASCARSPGPTIGAASPSPDARALPRRSLPAASATRTTPRSAAPSASDRCSAALAARTCPRVADQHPAQRHHRLAAVIPHRRARRELDRARAAAIPAHADLAPTPSLDRPAAAPSVGWRAPFLRGRAASSPARAVAPGHTSAASRRKRVITVTGWASAAQAASNSMRRIGAIGDHDQLPIGQPAPQLRDHLARPVGQLSCGACPRC